jgi:hypothetical protein
MPNKKTRTQQSIANKKQATMMLNNNQTLFVTTSDWLCNSHGQSVMADANMVTKSPVQEI